RAGARRHAHQRDDHAVALDHAALDRGVIRSALDVVHSGKVKQIFAGACALGAGGTGLCWLARHCPVLSLVHVSRYMAHGIGLVGRIVVGRSPYRQGSRGRTRWMMNFGSGALALNRLGEETW